jgi:hypothetical protein
LQVVTHVPLPLQVEPEAFGALVVHTWLQAPQLPLSVSSSTHAVPQRVVGDVQVHCPLPLQLWPAGHECPHEPQLLLSVDSSTQVPPHSV